MKSILLIGLGRFGRNIAEKLHELRHEVMAIDQQEERVKEVLPFVTNALIGDSTNPEFLKSLGVDNYDVCIVAIGDDFQSSLETTSLLKTLSAKTVVSRASTNIQASLLRKIGADEVVYPEKEVAEWTAIRYSANHLFDYIALEGEYSIFEVAVPEAWVNRAVGELGIRQKYAINILAVKENQTMNAAIGPDTVLHKENTLLVLGKDKDLYKCFKL